MPSFASLTHCLNLMSSFLTIAALLLWVVFCFFFFNMQVKWKLHNDHISVQGHNEITLRLAF